MLRIMLCLGLGLLLPATASAQRGNPQGSRDPIRPAVNVKELQGKIVKVDLGKDLVTIHFAGGAVAEDVEFLVTKNTKYYGKQRQALDEGLRSKAFAPGTDVWFQTGVGEQFRTIFELRLYNPALTPDNARPTYAEQRAPG
jgi:hypothetical protein